MLVNISDRLHQYLIDLPKPVLLKVMLNAVDEMQSYNGRSHTAAIMLALGAEAQETERGSLWAYPNKDEVIKHYGG